MQSQIWGLGGQVLGWNGLPLNAPFPIPFIITGGGTGHIPKYTYDLGNNWIPVDTTTGSYGTPWVSVYGITGQYKHVWSYDGIHMFFTSYNVGRTKSRVWYTNDGGKTMSYFDKSDASPYEGRQFGTWTEDNNKAYVTGWTNQAKLNYSLNNFVSVLESSTGQPDGNYPLILSGSKNGQYVYGGVASAGGVIVSSDYGANFTLYTLTGSGHSNAPICDDTGQYATITGDAATGWWFTSNYGANWTQISVNTPIVYMFYDATMIMYVTRTAPTNYFNFTTNQGGSWTSLSFPTGVVSGATLSLDNKNKVVYLFQGNVVSPNNKLWKLNAAKNGWDEVGTFANRIYSVGTSELGRGVCVIDYSSHIWFSPSPANSGSWIDIGTSADSVGTLVFANVI